MSLRVTNFRGCAVADVNNDDIKDVTFCTNYGTVISLDGTTGNVIRSFDLRAYAVDTLGDTSSIFEVDNAPIIADYDNDGILDLFIIGGKGRSDTTTYTDYGYAFCLSWGAGNGPAWTMFRHDDRRTGCLCDSNNLPLSTLHTAMNNDIGLSVFPNPSSGAFAVGFTLMRPQVLSMSVVDMAGRVVLPPAEKLYQQGANTISVASEQAAALSNGLYFVQLKGAGVNVNAKLVINR